MANIEQPYEKGVVEFERIRRDLERSLNRNLGHTSYIEMKVVEDGNRDIFLDQYFLEINTKIEITEIELHEKEEQVMPKDSLIVSKPQFDVDALKAGKAVTILNHKKVVRNSYAVECLIVKAHPLWIKVAYLDEEPRDNFNFDDHMETQIITIDEYVRGDVEVSTMIVDTKN